MDLANNTVFPVELARAVLPYRDLMLATVVAKCGFEVSTTGDVSRAVDQPPPEDADLVTPYGTIDGDMVPIKHGCDFAIMGAVRGFPPGSLVSEHSVRLRVGDFARDWRVFGDRRWRKTSGGFEATPAEPFTEMVLGYEKAYGGAAIWERRRKVACDENPAGKGFVMREEHVEGLALPNLEDADQLIRTWQDRPRPAGLAPLPRHSALRAARGYQVDRDTQTAVIEPLAFCFSHPAMMLPAFPDGARFELVGLGPHQSMSFTVPSVKLLVRLQLGGREHELALIPDTLCVFPDVARFHVVARRAFVYQFIPERVRVITVEAGRVSGEVAHPTIRDARIDSSAGVLIAPDDEDLPIPFDELLRLNPLTELVESLPLCASL